MSKNKIIPRRILFDSPDRSGVKLSPDGNYITWIAPRDGVLNIWMARRGDENNAICLTHDKHRGISAYFWAFDNQTILYIQDHNGNENWNLYALNVQTQTVRNLTALENVHAQVIQLSTKYPTELIIGLNDRRPEFHDLYRLHIHSGALEMIFQNDEYVGFLLDHDLNIRFATKMTPEGGSEIYDLSQEEPQLFCHVGMEDLITTSLLGFNADNTIVYMQDSRNRNTAVLTQVDLSTNIQKVLAGDPQADMCDALIHPEKKIIQAFASNYDRKRWYILDPDIESHLDRLWELDNGDVEIISRTRDDSLWIVAYLQDNGPVKYYIYDTLTEKASYLFSSKAALEGLPLVPMHPVIIRTRDDWEMVGYLSLPREADPESTGRPKTPQPLVLMVHGGPTARDTWGYDAKHQWLTNRGYAVLSVNYRGSTGFGKDFIVAGYGEWAGKAHNDLIDAVHWAIDQGIALEDKVAIMGGSYGGYATLVGMTMTPDVFACGIDIVGPSNLITLLESVPPYWKPMLDMLKVRIGGDHETEAGRAFLRSQSPLNFVHQIKNPLLIAQGANDPRVKQAESDQIVQAMRSHKIPVTYILYSDEGHGFVRPENRLSFYAVAEDFLSRTLGGIVEEVGRDFENSTIQILQGGESFAPYFYKEEKNVSF